jgi:hypothetical protein
MIVLGEKCKRCNKKCNTIRFRTNFVSWTSGNDDIDKFIQETQLSTHRSYEVFKTALEWIPYSRFSNITYEKIGIYHKANWIDGKINYWDNKNQNWQRFDQNMIVVLKRLNNPKNVTLKLMNEVLFNELLKF